MLDFSIENEKPFIPEGRIILSDLTINQVFASQTPGGSPTGFVHTGQPFSIEVSTTATDEEEFNEGKDYGLQVDLKDPATGTVFLSHLIIESLGDSNWPLFPTNQFHIPTPVAGLVNTIYVIEVTTLKSGRNLPDVASDSAFPGDSRVLTPAIWVVA
jgi:hypothetical protein